MRFGQLPIAARIYILGVIAVAALGSALACLLVPIWPWSGDRLWTWFALLAIGATVAHSFPVSVPGKQAYHVSLPLLMAGVLLLPPSGAVLLLVVVHLGEWLRRRRSWYAQMFNVSAYVSAALLAEALIALLDGGAGVGGWSGQVTSTAIGLAAAGCFGLVNRILVSLVIWLANGIPIRQQQMFHPESLLTDAVLLALGVPVAYLAAERPLAGLILGATLVLIHRVLDMPNIRAQRRQDALTQLYTESSLADACRRELSRASRFGRPTALLIVDIDNLTRINADHGQQAGDAIIQGTAQLLERHTRGYDLAARLTGGQFAILMPEADLPQATAKGEAIRAVVARHTYELPSSLEPVSVTVSVGVAVAYGAVEAPDRLIATAEKAIGDAKRAGRNAVRALEAGSGGPVAPVSRPASESAPVAASAGPPASSATGAAAAAGGADGHAPVDALAAEPAGLDPAAPAAAPRRPPIWANSRYQVWAFSALVVAASAGLSLWSLPDVVDLPLWPILVLLGLAVLAETGRLDISQRSSFSIGAVPVLAGAMLLGPAGAIVIAPVGALIRGVTRRSRWYKVLFNASAYVLAAALAAHGFAALPVEFGAQHFWWLVGPACLAGLIYYGHTFLVAIAMGLEVQTSPVRLWSEHFRWLWPQYAVLGAMGLLLALAYAAFGLGGITAFLAPPIMLRYVAKQYIDRTQQNVRQLRELNDQLQSEIRHRIAAEEENARLAEEAAKAAALAELSRLKSEFISIASHELRTPMAAIMGFSELLLLDTPEDDPRHRMLSIVHEHSKQLSSLVDNLLDVSRIETGRMRIEPAAVDVGRALAPLADGLRASSPSHNLEINVPVGSAWVHADPERLNQILTNLLSNAIKYSPDGGAVRVTAAPEPSGKQLTISISDEGIGIPAEFLARIFERFQRVDSSETRRIQGSGLGLYIVRHLVELHGGTIRVDSTVGQGSTFHVTLPIAAAPPPTKLDPPRSVVGMAESVA